VTSPYRSATTAKLYPTGGNVATMAGFVQFEDKAGHASKA